jgi:hypothetical protein
MDARVAAQGGDSKKIKGKKKRQDLPQRRARITAYTAFFTWHLPILFDFEFTKLRTV